MSPHASPSGHGRHYLHTFKTNPLKVWIVESLVGQNLLNKLLGLVCSLIKSNAWLLGNMCSTYIDLSCSQIKKTPSKKISKTFCRSPSNFLRFSNLHKNSFKSFSSSSNQTANNSHTKLVDVSTILFICDVKCMKWFIKTDELRM